MAKRKRKTKKLHPSARRLHGAGKKRRKNPAAEGWEREDYSEQDIREALARPDSFGYSGDLPIFETWSLGPVIEHRDATILAKANRKALEAELEKRKEWEDQWAITGASHWAVGWVDHLSFEVLDERGEVTDIARFLKHWFGYLNDVYPVADDDLYSNMQFEAYSEQLEQDLNDLERSKLKERLPKNWRDKMYDKLRDIDWDYDAQDVPYHTEATLEEVAGELGYLDEELEDNPADQPPTYIVVRSDHTGNIVAGELTMIGSDGVVVLYDEYLQAERYMEFDGQYWNFIDGASEDWQGYEFVALVTPRVEALQLAANPIGPGLGSAIGAWAGSAAATMTSLLLGFYGGAAGILLAWSVSTLGAAVGGRMAAKEDRKRRVTIGASVGNAIFPILGIGAAVGGWIGGKRADPKEVQELRRRREKERRSRDDNPRSATKHSVRKIKNRVLR